MSRDLVISVDEQLLAEASGKAASAHESLDELVRGWLAEGLDVYVYFDNDVKVRSPYDAMGLRERLG